MVHAAGPHLQVIRPYLHAAPCYYALACSCKSSFLRGTLNRTALKNSTKRNRSRLLHCCSCLYIDDCKQELWTWTKLCSFVGGALFVISDSILGFDKFVSPIPYSQV